MAVLYCCLNQFECCNSPSGSRECTLTPVQYSSHKARDIHTVKRHWNPCLKANFHPKCWMIGFPSSSFSEAVDVRAGSVTTSQRSLVTAWPMNRLKGLKSAAQSHNSSGLGLGLERETSRLQVITNKHGCKYLQFSWHTLSIFLLPHCSYGSSRGQFSNSQGCFRWRNEYGLGLNTPHTPRVKYLMLRWHSWGRVLSTEKGNIPSKWKKIISVIAS